MRLPRMTVRHLMIGAALGAIASALYAHTIKHDRSLLITMARFAVLEARRDLGDLSEFDTTARWEGSNVQVEFRSKDLGQEGRRYLVGFIGEILSAQPLPSP